MKIGINSLRLINHHYKTTGEIMPEGIDALVDKIGAQLGAVESVTHIGKKYEGIVVAKVVSCVKHPNADKLSLCKIDDGGVVKKVNRDKDGLVQVVCGAPNVREALHVAWIPPGVAVPSSVGKELFVLEAREIRGQVSNGMLASASELAISDDHSGIVELDDAIKPGSDFARALNLDEYVIDIENKMFTHRPDCFGFLGIARELAGIQHMAFKSPKWYELNPKLPKVEGAPIKFKVMNRAHKLVPRFTAIAMSDVKVGPSPLWLQIELSKVGSRSINNIVDYTNYFMLLTGQPLHAYDADKLPAPSLETRMSKKSEKLKLLNGKEITFEDDSSVLITSGDRAVGIGGVMGGADTEVDMNTKNIVIECANFDMYSIRRTSMRYGLFTDAVTRFNKGQSPHQNLAVLAKIVDEIRQNASGKVASAPTDDNHASKKLPMVRVSTKFVNERLGLELLPDEVQKLLTNVEFKVERTDNKDELKVTAPFWRTDIEIPEDIVEEVGRLYGYDQVPLELPSRSILPSETSQKLALKSKLRDKLAAAGANEVLTYSFVHGDLLRKVGQDTKDSYELSNALSPDLQYYRQSLTPSLLDKVHMNIKAGHDQFALFEINKTHIKGQNDNTDKDLPREFENLALVVAASSKVKTIAKDSGAAYFQARRYLDEVASALGLTFRYEKLSEAPTYPAAAPFDYKRSARVYLGDKILGLVGEYKTSVQKQLKLPDYCAGFEISIGSEELLNPGSTYTPLSRYPSVQQDISLKVPAKQSYGEVYDFLQANLSVPTDSKTSLDPIDIYQGKDTKHTNMTFRLTIASYEKTLTDPEVNKILDDLATKAHDNLGIERQ